MTGCIHVVVLQHSFCLQVSWEEVLVLFSNGLSTLIRTLFAPSVNVSTPLNLDLLDATARWKRSP